MTTTHPDPDRSIRTPSAPSIPVAPVAAAGLLLLLLSAAAVGPARGQGPAAAEGPRPEIPMTGSEHLESVHRPEEGVYEIIVGPVDLEAGMPHLRLPVQVDTLPMDGWLRGFSWSLTGPDGEELPDELLHHVNLIDPDRRELFSPIARRVLAAGRETRTATLPASFGYPLEPGTRVLVSAMFANQTETDYEDARLHVKLRYVKEGGRLVRPQAVYPFYLDVMGPVGPKSFPVPPGRTVESWSGSPAIDARIMGVGAHLHDYAEVIRLVDETTDEVVWEARPITGEDGEHVKAVPMDPLWRTGGEKLFADHTYRVEVVYENPTDRPAPDGGMGVVAGVVLAPEGTEWPGFDRSDPAYREDLLNTVRAPHEGGGHGHAHGTQREGREGTGPGR